MPDDDMPTDPPRMSHVPDTERGEGSAEHKLIETRREKAREVRRLSGTHPGGASWNPFANDVKGSPGARTLDIGEARTLAQAARNEAGRYEDALVRETASDARLHVRGRVMVMRSAGALTFLRVRDGTGEIQLLISKDGVGEAYAHLHLIDLGDFVEAEGSLIASKTGELSIETRRLRLITKAYRPPPEKWHGLQDVELRYRQRYVDLVANPPVADVFRARSHAVRALREILDGHGFLEVETPTMHTLIGGAAARPFDTHHNALDMRLYMRIAPELYLKRLVVGGLERVYEIGRCYRNEGISTRHNPEFTMLEFYRAYATYDDLMDFTEVLLRGVDERVARAMPEAHAVWKQARPFTFDAPFVRIPMDRAVAEAAERTAIPAWLAAVSEGGGFGLVKLLREGLGAHIKEWAKSSPRAKGLDWGNFRKGLAKCDTDGERLFALYEYLAEPYVSQDYRSDDGKHSVPVFIKDYPFEVSPLARRNDRFPELTDRFELFVHGRELCNAFSELNDPDDQAARFQVQVERRAKGDEEAMDFDEDYIRALEHGMPPAAGFGMGIDRLVMMLTNAASIRDVILFPLLRPEAGPGGPDVKTLPIPMVVAAVAAVALAMAFLVWRAAIDFGRKETVRGVLQSVCATFGGLFVAFTYWTEKLPVLRGSAWTVRDALVRAGAIAAGVLFLVGTVVSMLPWVLDRMEAGPLASYVAARHVRARKSGFLTLISALSIFAVALASFSLSAAISVMGGFSADLKRKILGNNAHIVVDTTAQTPWGDYEATLARVQALPGVAAATPVVQGEVMASSASNLAGVIVHGIDPATIGLVIDLRKNIEAPVQIEDKLGYLSNPELLRHIPADEVIGIGPGGEEYTKGPDLPLLGDDLDPLVASVVSQPQLHPGLVIGRELAKTLHVFVGDDVTLVSPLGDLGPMGVLPKTRKFRIAAIFYSGMYEYDATHVYITMEEAQSYFATGGTISAIYVRVDDAENADRMTPAVTEAVGRPELRVRDWREMNKNLFSALKLERIATFLILSIEIIVASFCIVCTLLLMMTEKAKEIAILKALGATDGAIMRTFMTEGMIIGGIGTMVGVSTGVAMCTGLAWFGLRLDPDVYYIDRLPINVSFADYALVTFAALAICTIATIFPAKQAAQMRPVDGLRYE